MITLPEFSGRDIAVFGLARTGLAAARALMASGARVHAWDDSAEARTAAAAAGVSVSDFNGMDWRGLAGLVLSPGVPLWFPKPHRVVELARAVGVPILGDVELFARAVNALPAPARPAIVGVTGTNGKSTTTALIGHIVKASGKDVRVGGNIGTAVLDLSPLHAGAVYVLELSSYQLDLIESLRCRAAVFLNFSPDHLERHGSLDAYLAAKTRIFRNQGAGDWAILGVDDRETAGLCTELLATGGRQVVPISAAQALGRGVCALGGKLYDALEGRATEVLDLAAARALPGRHNAQNAAAAYAAARALGLPPRAIIEALATFPGLPHRLEPAGVIGPVRFVNDSKATNAESTAQALAVYDRVHWIVGGVAKAGGIAALAPFFPRIARAYLIGEAAGAFAQTLKGRAPHVLCQTLEAAVAQAYADALASGEPNPVVLLSPACASQDQFRDFEHRGDAFKALVAELAAQAAPQRALA